MHFYKQFNVVLNALDNRGEVVFRIRPSDCFRGIDGLIDRSIDQSIN